MTLWKPNVRRFFLLYEFSLAIKMPIWCQR
jgi:hypothetical protein